LTKLIAVVTQGYQGFPALKLAKGGDEMVITDRGLV
jgi:hypothetical protein